MCTEKQLEYVQKLAKWKGKPVDVDKIVSMSSFEVSALIDELKAVKSVKNGLKEQPKAVKGMIGDKPVEVVDYGKEVAEISAAKAVNKTRLGLAMKLVIQEVHTTSVLNNKEKYIAWILDLYLFMEKVEAKASALASSPVGTITTVGDFGKLISEKVIELTPDPSDDLHDAARELEREATGGD